ncbi:MAG: S1 RNA-binding domain-containing protein [Emcibacter sp.]|nr:S1 RNA-binding domain-containing protein [Emcibacter sp.]
MVHRALIGALKLGKDGLAKQDREKLVETADHISKTERISMIAERESTDRYVAAYMSQHVGEQFDARIAGVSRAGLFVAFNETGGDGFIPVSSMVGDYFRHDKELHMLEGEYTGIIYQLGGAITVRLKEANPMTGGLLCELIDPELISKASTRKPKSRSRSKGRPGNKRSRKQKR